MINDYFYNEAVKEAEDRYTSEINFETLIYEFITEDMINNLGEKEGLIISSLNNDVRIRRSLIIEGKTENITISECNEDFILEIMEEGGTAFRLPLMTGNPSRILLSLKSWVSHSPTLYNLERFLLKGRQ